MQMAVLLWLVPGLVLSFGRWADFDGYHIDDVVTGLGGARGFAVDTSATPVNVNITLNFGSVTPNPAFVDVGQTVTFTCDAVCNIFCIFTETDGLIPGISPFSLAVSPGATSAPLGPATSAGSISYRAEDLEQVCGPYSAEIFTTARVPAFHGRTGSILLVLLMATGGLTATVWQRRRATRA